MAKLTLTDLSNITGQETSAIAAINNNNSAIEAALEKTLSRDGTAPNAMNVDFDMNGNDILNVGTINVETTITVDGVDVHELVGIEGPQGPTGPQGADGISFIWRNNYSNTTSYAADDVVFDQNSSWIALQATTGNAPPSLPTESTAYWELMAKAGANGTGSGDVTAAANIANNAVVVGDGGVKGIKAHASGPPGGAAFLNVGTTTGTVAAGDDARITGALQPAAIGSTVQAYDADLASIAGLSRARGDVIRGGASAWERLALGASGYALKSNGTDTVWEPSREVLTANRTYFVRTDGSDSNNGLANTSVGAFLTIQKGLDVALSLDLNGYNVTISVGAGTYTAGVSMGAAQVGDGNITILGDAATPSNVVISTTNADCISVIVSGARLQISGLRLQTTTSGSCLTAANGGRIKATGAMVFGACATYHMRTLVYGVIDFEGRTYSIVGAAARHYSSEEGGTIKAYAATVTLTGTLAFSTFANAESLAIIQAGVSSYTGGTITGTRYAVSLNAVINTIGGGASRFPGNSAGTTATGGQYA